jgi:hypothetical protein
LGPGEDTKLRRFDLDDVAGGRREELAYDEHNSVVRERLVTRSGPGMNPRRTEVALGGLEAGVVMVVAGGMAGVLVEGRETDTAGDGKDSHNIRARHDGKWAIDGKARFERACRR